MQFFSSAVSTLQTLVVALGAGLAVWGVINLLEGYGSDNPGANALSLKQVDAFGWDTGDPIVFSEWAFVTGSMLQRSDYTFDKLLAGDEPGRDLFGKEQKTKKNSADAAIAV